MITSLGDKTFSVPLLPYRKEDICATQIHYKTPDHQNKEGTYSICDNINGLHGYCFKLTDPVIEGQILFYFTYMRYLK